MPDENNATPNGDAENKNGNAAGADQGNGKPDTAVATTFDPSKISDEEFGKVFDDPRTFQHSRFKELTDAQKELKQIKSQQKEAEQKVLAEQGKFKELAEAKDRELATLKEQSQNQIANLEILAAASKLGAVDPKVVLKLIDRTNVTVDENGNVTGAEEAVKSLLEASPYLKGKGNVVIGAGAPGEDANNQIKRFKHSQLLDPVFYKEHEADIMAAMKAGMVENDL